MMDKTTFLSNFGVDEKILAHTPNETLKEHSLLTFEYYKNILKEKNLEGLIDTLINHIDSNNFSLIKEMFESAILLHDLGKKSKCFQAKKMENKLFEEYKDCGDSRHSKSGALEYIEYYKRKIENFEEEEFYRLVYIFYSFAYTINKHHGKLDNMENYCSKTNNEKVFHCDFNNSKDYIDECLDNSFELYILNKLLFSLLISSDYYATTEYMAFKNKKKFVDFGLFNENNKKDLKLLFDNYLNDLGTPKGINKLRNKILQEASENLLKNDDKYIYYLEAPTGSGKTITSINLALQLLNNQKSLNKLFYIFPFNTLVEQTKNVFDKIFKNSLDIEVINSVTPIKEDENQEDEETKYSNSYINRLFYHSSTVITTHVNFFNILFGTSKEDNFALWQLANSVIILDEIQSYNNHLWWYMVEFFEKYAKCLNIKIIIMSATLPKLDYFLEEKSSFVNLINDEKRDYFFNHDYFKNRVSIEYLNLENKITFEELYAKLKEEVKNYNQILFEFISKQSAREFYNLIKDNFENVYELSGDDNKAYRQYVINQTKDKTKPIIIVATQVIEAGVDIDMDLGFKDISTIDSEEQFMGRINRSCKNSDKNPKVYFFDMDETKNIYKGDNRLGYDLKNSKYQEILKNKEFSKYYINVLKDIKTNKERFKNGLLTDYKNFKNDIIKLNYKSLSKTMTLISSETFTLYFPFKIDLLIYKNVREFENLEDCFLTNRMLDGKKVWDEYIKLNEVEHFAKREILKSKINSLMQFFTFSIFKYYEKQRPFIGEEINGYYFVKDYNEFITKDNKFDREQYNKIKNGNFL